MRTLHAFIAFVAVTNAQVLTFLDPPLISESFLRYNTPANRSVQCPAVQLTYCQASFNDYLNIDYQTSWKNVTAILGGFNTYSAQGQQGIYNLCEGAVMFRNCLGTAYDSCISTSTFLDTDNVVAFQRYVGVLKELDYQCNDGLAPLLKNWDCILSLTRMSTQSYEECKRAFTNATTIDPSTTCSEADRLTKCARAPLYLACGVEASQWEAGRTRASLGLDKQCPASSVESAQNLGKFIGKGEKLRHTQRASNVKVNHQAQFAKKMNSKLTR